MSSGTTNRWAGLAYMALVTAVLVFGLYQFWTEGPWLKRTIVSGGQVQAALYEPLDVNPAPDYCGERQSCLFFPASRVLRKDGDEVAIALGMRDLEVVPEPGCAGDRPGSVQCLVDDRNIDDVKNYYVANVESMFIALRHSVTFPNGNKKLSVSNVDTSGRMIRSPGNSVASAGTLFFDRKGRNDDRVTVAMLLQAAGISFNVPSMNGSRVRDDGVVIEIAIEYYGRNVKFASDISYTYTVTASNFRPQPRRSSRYNQTSGRLLLTDTFEIQLEFHSTATIDEAAILGCLEAIATILFLVVSVRALMWFYFVFLSSKRETNRSKIYMPSGIPSPPLHVDDTSSIASRDLLRTSPKAQPHKDVSASNDTVVKVDESFSFEPSIRGEKGAEATMSLNKEPMSRGSASWMMSQPYMTETSFADAETDSYLSALVSVESPPLCEKTTRLEPRATMVSNEDRQEIRRIMEQGHSEQAQQTQLDRTTSETVRETPSSLMLAGNPASQRLSTVSRNVWGSRPTPPPAIEEHMYLQHIEQHFGVSPTANQQAISKAAEGASSPLRRKGPNIERWPGASSGHAMYQYRPQYAGASVKGSDMSMVVYSPLAPSHPNPEAQRTSASALETFDSP
ncbi:hypothetical protein HDU67_002768 [Dinochytrium kinnereticum]|nr:hypothetical protein HDU67_002768 [Dinochytrium kinnereticum]